jgi:hypothetical protein
MGHYKSDCPEIKMIGGETCQINQDTTLMTHTSKRLSWKGWNQPDVDTKRQ